MRTLPAVVIVALIATSAPSIGQAHEADDLALVDRGNTLIRRMGCAACHATGTPADIAFFKTGPDLRRIASKLDPEWAVEFLLAPRSVRPTTVMPHLFDPDDPDEVRDVVAYLWQASERVNWAPVPQGDVGRGESLFHEVGCTACHVRDPDAQRSQLSPLRLHGPNLARLAEKVTADWLHAWLTNAEAYAPETKMPNLRLSRGQAVDLTAFLLAGSDEHEPRSAGAVPGPGDVAAGREAIERYGCSACHRIAGFDDDPSRAGDWTSLERFTGHGMAGLVDYGLDPAELAAIRAAAGVRPDPGAEVAGALREGRALVESYNCRGCHLIERRGRAIGDEIEDVGLLPPDLNGEGSRVNPDWLARYLVDPGATRLRAWLTVEMPDFRLTQEQARKLVDYFVALEPEPLPIAPASPLDARAIALGHEVYDLMPCGGCHPYGRQALEAVDLDAAVLAPPLEIASRRLRYGWISSWLADPQGWSPGTRMPSFFPLRSGIPSSPCAGLATHPSFAEPAAKMLRHVDSPAELSEFLDDGQAMIDAIRDYVWSLEPPEDQ